jgi:predicted Zn-dependent peptidase
MNLYVHRTDKFKTFLAQLVFHRALRREDVTATALLPAVLQRGSASFPTRRLLAYRLEELYGSEMSAEVVKKGERLLVSFSVELVNDRYLPEEEGLLGRCLEILSEVVNRPVTEGEAFKREYVSQEKEQHEKVIQGLVNDKAAYAMERCLQEMCVAEPFGVFKYGTLAELATLGAANLYDFYRRFLAESPVDLHVCGELDAMAVRTLAEQMFSFPRNGVPEIPKTLVRKQEGDVRSVREEMDVSQGKLVLGFRTGITYGDDDYFPLLMYNGILGGFPHSKLFLNVREKASLAYYAYSRLEKHKGLMVISSGIETGNYDKALEIIKRQVECIAAGEINEEEFTNTWQGLRNQLLMEDDHQGLVINRAIDSELAGRGEDTDSLLAGLAAVKPEDVVRVAREVKLDTVYFLAGKGGGAA